MNILRKKIKFQNLIMLLTMSMSVFMVSCGDDDDPILADASFSYAFHNGQTVPSAPYTGLHSGDLVATLDLQEMSNGNTMVTVSLTNTVDGATYRIHAHDAADATTTPNGTPYNETPNGDILAQSVDGNGGTVSVSQEASMSLTDLSTSYEGFFVVHDPLQAISTSDITTYLVLGSFARTQVASSFDATSFSYDFNTGQLVSAFAYVGTHTTDLGASVNVTELADGRSRITVMIDNTMDGMMYHTHAHDMADANTTPNGTPYNETPNGEVFASPIMGNGGTAGHSSISSMSYAALTTTYDGFFVIHDPLQAIDTTNPATYVVLGVFAR